MPLPIDLRPRLQSALRPRVAKLARRGLTPNRLTLIEILLAGLVGGLIALAPTVPIVLLLLPAAVMLRLVMTAIFGILVEEHGLGASPDRMMREVGEALADALLYLPLALHPGVAGWLVVVVVVLGMVAELAAVAASGSGSGRRTDGPLRRADRALLFGLVGLILAVDPRASAWLPWLLLPAAVLAGITIYNRMRKAIEQQTASGPTAPPSHPDA